MIPDPRGYDDFQMWAADAATLEFPDISVHADDWVLWAEEVVQSARGRELNLPGPYSFTTWQDWAERVYGVVQ